MFFRHCVNFVFVIKFAFHKKIIVKKRRIILFIPFFYSKDLSESFSEEVSEWTYMKGVVNGARKK